MKEKAPFWWVSAAILFFDHLTKWLVASRFGYLERMELLPGLALTYVRNKGAAFSMLADAPDSLRIPFFLVVTVAALFAVAYSLRATPSQDRLSVLGLGLVAGGAVGNAIDRLRLGEVVDFIEVGVPSVYTWPVFNVADSAVCVGVGFLVWRAWRPWVAVIAADAADVADDRRAG